MENIDPDTLLKKMDKKSMKSDMFVSIVLHLLVIGLTSFGLYASWAKWGVHSPSKIKMLEKAAAKQAAKEAAEKKAQEEAKAAATNNVEKAAAPESKDAEQKPAASEAQNGNGAQPQQLPLDKQVEEPPKMFELNELSL